MASSAVSATTATPAHRRIPTLDGWRGVAILEPRRFHLRMAFAVSTMLFISIVGCQLTSIRIPDAGSRGIALAVVLAAVMSLPVYWHEKQRKEMREAALVIPWALVLAIILPLSVDVGARVAMPLQDANFVRLDHMLGISEPQISAWASRHWIGHLINRSYPLLFLLLPAATFLPALIGKWIEAREFVVSNIAAFAIGIPLFSLLPAIGPWYGYHLAAGAGQLECQSYLLLLRVPGPIVSHAAGIVCFPSFHVIWAILSARALWGFRFLRLPVGLLSGLMILSTITTGWHYFVDVLGGVFVASLSIALAQPRNVKEPQPLELGPAIAMVKP
jgi:PAP2 superfamily